MTNAFRNAGHAFPYPYQASDLTIFWRLASSLRAVPFKKNQDGISAFGHYLRCSQAPPWANPRWPLHCFGSEDPSRSGQPESWRVSGFFWFFKPQLVTCQIDCGSQRLSGRNGPAPAPSFLEPRVPQSELSSLLHPIPSPRSAIVESPELHPTTLE